MPNKKAFLLLVLALFGVAVFWSGKSNSLTLKSISERHKRGDLALSAEETKAMRDELALRVRKYGMEETYKYLRENFLQQGSSINHTIQHYFGEMVYERMGFEGISFCGYSYPNGCSHGLILKTIKEEGYETAIKKVVDSCAKAGNAKISCVHILGHEFEIRYQDQGVARALQECSSLNLGTQFSTCGSGVFMQYYFPDIYEGGSTAQMRPFDESHAYDLCKPLTGLFRRACTLYTVEWWQFGLNKDYAKVFSLCRSLPSFADQNDCAKSVGVMIADNFSSEAGAINAACSLAGSDKEKGLCLAGAVKFLIENDKREMEDASRYICRDAWKSCMQDSALVYY